MTLKNKLETKIKGWFPQTPSMGIIRSTENNQKPDKWGTLPFSALGTLMIVASLISVAIGASIVWNYLSIFPVQPGDEVLYTALYRGILSLAASAAGLYSGIQLLARKQIAKAVTGICAILAFGLVTLLIPLLEGLPAQSGLQIASPMIVSSIAALCITGFKMEKQKTELPIQKELPASSQRALTGLAAFGTGFTMVGVLFYFQPDAVFPKSAVVLSLAVGISLIAAAFLGRRKYKH